MELGRMNQILKDEYESAMFEFYKTRMRFHSLIRYKTDKIALSILKMQRDYMMRWRDLLFGQISSSQ